MARPYLKGNPWRHIMGELYKTQHTIDEMLDRMGVKIVLDSEHLSEEDKFEAEKNGASVVLKKVSDKEDKKDGKDEKAIRLRGNLQLFCVFFQAACLYAYGKMIKTAF